MNVRAAWQLTTPEDRAYGRTWYPREQQWCRNRARHYGFALSEVCGVYAALSPNQSWMMNRLAVDLMCSWSERTVGNYGRDLWKAREVMLGHKDPAEILRGPKTMAFYRLLVDGGNDIDVCVDGHIANMARNEVVPLKGIHLTARDYEEIADEIRLVAMLERERPCDLQATLWWAWRRSPRLRQHSLAFA